MKNEMKLFTDGTITTSDGKRFTRVIGGFGENKPTFTIWQSGELLGLKTQSIRENFENNEENFDNGVDFIDLKVAQDENVSKENVEIINILKNIGCSRQKLNATKRWLTFSFAGMMKLVKIATTKESWDIYDNFLEDYFKTKAENKEYKKTLKEELQELKNERASLLGMATFLDDEAERLKSQKKAENLMNRIIKIQSTLDNERIKIVLEQQSKLTEAKKIYMNQSELGSLFNLKLGAKTVGKIFKIIGLAKKSYKNTIPYEHYCPKYATNILNEELGTSNFKWNYNECKVYLDNWLCKKGLFEKFYFITDKNIMIDFINDLYDTYVLRIEE